MAWTLEKGVAELASPNHVGAAAVFQGRHRCYFDTALGGVVVEFREEYGRQV